MTHTDDDQVATLVDAVTQLARELAEVRLPLAAPGAEHAERVRVQLVEQVDDYLLPRLREIDAPLLMVVGGSTGAGKSTLVNSLVGRQVSASGVLRPTTRSPVLAAHPADMHWFQGDRVLPGLSRTTGGAASGRGLQLVDAEELPRGVALLDAPDIDSVVEDNRVLASQLLAAADAWLFVTTAARYADAVPWQLLESARERGTSLSLVLDRIAPEATADIVAHLARMVQERGLAGTQILTVAETELQGGLLPGPVMRDVRVWLDALAADAESRAGLVSRTLDGAIVSIPARVAVVREALLEQERIAAELAAAVDDAYADAREHVASSVRSGAMLRGEVLARWQDVIGTGDIMRSLESKIGWARDRVRSFITGAPSPEVELRGAVRSGVDALVIAAADRAAERAVATWRTIPAGRALLDGAHRPDAASRDLGEQVDERVRQWQGQILELVRTQAAGKRASARLASLGINAVGLTVMIAVFASTGGLTGAEVVVAGGTGALSQKVLEAIFGDQAVRELAERAREQLMEHVDELLDGEAQRLRRLLDPATPDTSRVPGLDAGLAALEQAR